MRANALLLLDDGMSCEEIAKVLYLDDDTIRYWYQLYSEKGPELAGGFWVQRPRVRSRRPPLQGRAGYLPRSRRQRDDDGWPTACACRGPPG